MKFCIYLFNTGDKYASATVVSPLHTIFTNGDTLSVGLNFFADLTGTNGEVNLPTSGNSSEGDVIYVKAGDLDASSDIVIMANTGQNIDGAAAIALESPFAAVTLVYVSTNNWRIV